MAGIIGDALLVAFRVLDGTYEPSTLFLDEHLAPWLDEMPLLFRRQLIFMHANHIARATTFFIASLGIKNETLMTWSSCYLDLNPIEQQ